MPTNIPPYPSSAPQSDLQFRELYRRVETLEDRPPTTFGAGADGEQGSPGDPGPEGPAGETGPAGEQGLSLTPTPDNVRHWFHVVDVDYQWLMNKRADLVYDATVFVETSPYTHLEMGFYNNSSDEMARTHSRWTLIGSAPFTEWRASGESSLPATKTPSLDLRLTSSNIDEFVPPIGGSDWAIMEYLLKDMPDGGRHTVPVVPYTREVDTIASGVMDPSGHVMYKPINIQQTERCKIKIMATNPTPFDPPFPTYHFRAILWGRYMIHDAQIFAPMTDR